MPLAPGTRLGPYEILHAIGAGGMGQVFRARDTRLDRDVAIKVLPDAFSSDPDRRTRFEREAKAVAALSHPNILAIHDIGEHTSRVFVVTELLEGETLRERLIRGALPVRKAIDIASQILHGLATAHEKAIIHRDLKPENVFLLTDGQVKILDFGLAKHAQDSSGATETVSLMTDPGTVMGTVGYMAPEQVRGLAIDARTDLFSLGAVLFEMMTGARAFGGATSADVMTSILREDPPDLTSARADVPPALERIVRHCLEKNPAERFQSARDVDFALRSLSDTGSDVSRAFDAVHGARRWPDRRMLIWTLAGLLVGAGVSAVAPWPRAGSSAEPAREVIRASITTGPAEAIGPTRPSRTAIALSPDGRLLVFAGTERGTVRLYVRELGRLEARPLEGTEAAESPFFSATGQWIGFWTPAGGPGEGEIRKVPVGGGPAVTLCKTPRLFGASWGSDDRIVFANQTGGLWRVPASGGGEPERLTTIDPRKETSHRLPHVLPGAQAVVFTIQKVRRRWDDAQIAVRSLVTNEQTVLVERGADARYVSSGHLVFVRAATLMAIAFDPTRLRTTGGAVGVVDGVMAAVNASNSDLDSGGAQFNVSGSGTLVYVPGGIVPDTQSSLEWVDRRTGRVEPLMPPVTGYAYAPRISPEGQRVVFENMRMGASLWMYDIHRKMLTGVKIEGQSWWAIWTPDGKRLTYRSASAGFENLFWEPADDSAPAERLVASDRDQTPGSWTPDGRVLAFVESELTTEADIWALSRENGQWKKSPIVQTTASERDPEFSPDGKWLAYASNESGRPEVFVQAYPTGPRTQISSEGGLGPVWRGRELFYMATAGNTARIMVVDVTSPTSPGIPRLLFSGPYGTGNPARGYDVTGDGQRFLMVKREAPPATPIGQMVIIVNWQDELRRLVSQ